MSLAWQPVRDYEDITYDKADGIARIVINRPERAQRLQAAAR